MRKQALIVTGTAIAIVLAAAIPIFSHCQIPCGIYDDQMRFEMIAEHIATIEKSINEIERLSASGEKNYNQIVRWIENKDYHADELTSIVTHYFLAQRIKPVEAGDGEAHGAYVKKLELLHRMMVRAMKAKQNTDLEHAAKLRELLEAFRAAYFGAVEEGAVAFPS